VVTCWHVTSGHNSATCKHKQLKFSMMQPACYCDLETPCKVWKGCSQNSNMNGKLIHNPAINWLLPHLRQAKSVYGNCEGHQLTRLPFLLTLLNVCLVLYITLATLFYCYEWCLWWKPAEPKASGCDICLSTWQLTPWEPLFGLRQWLVWRKWWVFYMSQYLSETSTSLKVPALKELLKACKLLVGGKKQDLLRCLEASDSSHEQDAVVLTR